MGREDDRPREEPDGGYRDGPRYGWRAPGPADPKRLGLMYAEDGLPIRDADGHYETLHSIRERGRRALVRAPKPPLLRVEDE
jgi:hypothetical protein